MIDRVAIKVSDLKASAAFYEKALAPLGYKRFIGDFDGAGGEVLWRVCAGSGWEQC